jgi:signal peptidase
VLLFLRDAGIALLFVALVLLAMYAYTGLWPPLVVVESNSMMHGTDNLSHIGTIDTGDLVLVRDIGDVDDIETYVDGFVFGHKTYGDFGDVVVYRRDGSQTQTPIIHRAMLYLEINEDGHSYRAPSLQYLAAEKWSTSNPMDTWDHLTSVIMIYHVGWNDITVNIDVNHFIPYRGNGYITKGDHNPTIDQMASNRPVDVSWIVGKARGEIPWFGLLKLWTTDTLGSEAPENSVRNLWISIGVIVILPIGIDVGLTFKEKQEIAKKKAAYQAEQKKEDAAKAEEPVRSAGEPKQRT